MSGAMLFGGIFLGLAVLVNFIFIVHKFKKGRYIDAVTDITVIMLASSLYGASVMGGVIATIGSMFISIYLHFAPLKLFPEKEESERNFMPGSIEDFPDAVEGQELHKKWADKFDNLFK